MDNLCSLNFITDPEKYGTKIFLNKENPIMVTVLPLLKKRESERKLNIKYNFCSFSYPNLNTLFYGAAVEMVEVDLAKTLIITLDNSFDLIDHDSVSTNYIFIDHHLYEQYLGSCPYTSNTSMIYKNFTTIAKVLNKIINEKEIEHVGILFHTDLDGIGSGLLLAKIMELILSNSVDTISSEDIESAGLALVLGEYGDISSNKEDVLSDVFNQKDSYTSGLKKKIEILSKNLGRYFKAIRPIIDVKSHYESSIEDEERLIDKYNGLLLNYEVGYYAFLNSYKNIKNYFNDIKIVNNFEIINFLSMIVQDPINARIINLVQKEIDLMVDNYLRPITPQIDFTMQFTNVDEKPIYKVLIIDSPMDVGRSVIWTYKGRLRYFKDDADLKKFTMANYKRNIPEMIMQCKNIACYNMFSGKLSLHSDEGNSAFNVAKAFGGGGHLGIDNGSLGSVSLDSDTLKNNSIIISMV